MSSAQVRVVSPFTGCVHLASWKLRLYDLPLLIPYS